MKFATIKIGEMFNLVSVVEKRGRKAGEKSTSTIVKQVCRKASHTGYALIGEEYAGEVQYYPDMDEKIEYPIQPDAPTPGA